MVEPVSESMGCKEAFNTFYSLFRHSIHTQSMTQMGVMKRVSFVVGFAAWSCCKAGIIAAPEVEDHTCVLIGKLNPNLWNQEFSITLLWNRSLHLFICKLKNSVPITCPIKQQQLFSSLFPRPWNPSLFFFVSLLLLDYIRYFM